MKKTIAAILAITLALSLGTLPAFADDDDWAGDSGYGDWDDDDWDDDWYDDWDDDWEDDRHAKQFTDWPQPADAAPAPADGVEPQRTPADVAQLTNSHRQAAGLSSLRVDEELQRAAKVRAAEIAVSFSHTRPDGAAWHTVSSAVNGENLGMGYRGAEDAVDGWMNSAGHKANILNTKFTRIGTASVEVEGTLYWVQLFGI